MRGMELPINALIIVVIAVMVLVAIIAFFYSGFLGPNEMISAKTALSNACIKLQNYNCGFETKVVTLNNFDANKNGKIGITEGTSNFDWDAPPANCDPATIPDATIYGDNLASLCYCYYQVSSERECKNLCNLIC